MRIFCICLASLSPIMMATSYFMLGKLWWFMLFMSLVIFMIFCSCSALLVSFWRWSGKAEY